MRPEGAFLPRPARGTWFGAEDLLIGIRETDEAPWEQKDDSVCLQSPSGQSSKRKKN